MSLSRIKFANKKSKRERSRKAKQQSIRKKTLNDRKMMNQQRKMIEESRRAKRSKELDYVNQLTSEVLND